MKTFGEFFDETLEAVERDRVHSAGAHMKWWAEDIPAEELERMRAAPMDQERYKAFLVAMQTMFVTRLSQICTDGLYRSTYQGGREFVRLLAQKGRECGLAILPEFENIPLSTGEILVAKKHARVAVET